MKRLVTSLIARGTRRERLDPERLRALRPRRILIVRQQNQMGDMVCATPVFRALRTAYPEARIALVTAPVNHEVVRNNPDLDEVFTFEQRLWRRPGRLLRFVGRLRAFGADLTFVLASVSFSVTSAGLALASGARWVVGADSRPYGFDLSRHAFSLELPSRPEVTGNAVDHALEPLRAVGFDVSDRRTVVRPAPDEERAADGILAGLGLASGFWALHPGAGKRQNIWPTERFADMARRAVATGARILVLHGPADTREVDRLRELLEEEVGRGVLVAPPCPVGVGAALLQRAGRFLCNDTGVMHVAGALGVPTVALFGPTDPALWKPPVATVRAIRSPRRSEDARGTEYGWLENIDPDEVWRAWQACAPPNAGAQGTRSGSGEGGTGT